MGRAVAALGAPNYRQDLQLNCFLLLFYSVSLDESLLSVTGLRFLSENLNKPTIHLC